MVFNCKRKIFVGFLLGCCIVSMSDAVDILESSLIDANTDYCTVDTLGISENNSSTGIDAIWIRVSVECVAGTYLKAGEVTCSTCETNYYCIGNTYLFNETIDQGIVACTTGVSPTGSKTAYDCGRRLHIGDNVMYLHTNPNTTAHHLVIQVDNTNYYANLTTTQTNMNADSEQKLKVQFNDTTYYVYDNTVDVEQ